MLFNDPLVHKCGGLYIQRLIIVDNVEPIVYLSTGWQAMVSLPKTLVSVSISMMR